MVCLTHYKHGFEAQCEDCKKDVTRHMETVQNAAKQVQLWACNLNSRGTAPV